MRFPDWAKPNQKVTCIILNYCTNVIQYLILLYVFTFYYFTKHNAKGQRIFIAITNAFKVLLYFDVNKGKINFFTLIVVVLDQH